MEAVLITRFVNVYVLGCKNTTHYKLKINFGQNLAKIFRIINFYVIAVTPFFAPYFANFYKLSLCRREFKKTLLCNYKTGNLHIT